MKNFVIILLTAILYTKLVYAISDREVLEEGQVLVEKVYSKSESTLIVSRYANIYVCSVSGSFTNCMLTNTKTLD